MTLIDVLFLGNCDICEDRKISFANETKQYKIWLRPRGWFQKIFQTLPPDFFTVLYESCVKFHPFCMAWMKVSKMKWIIIYFSVNLMMVMLMSSQNVVIKMMLQDSLNGRWKVSMRNIGDEKVFVQKTFRTLMCFQLLWVFYLNLIWTQHCYFLLNLNFKSFFLALKHSIIVLKIT